MQYMSLKYPSVTFDGTPASDQYGNYIACSLKFAHPEWIGTFFQDENDNVLSLKELNYAKGPDGRVSSCKYYY
jgi:hypothetical protein